MGGILNRQSILLECKTAMTAFEAKIEECRKLAGDAACTCWSSDVLSDNAATIKGCSCKFFCFY